MTVLMPAADFLWCGGMQSVFMTKPPCLELLLRLCLSCENNPTIKSESNYLCQHLRVGGMNGFTTSI